jgi:hypothetical protein
MHKTIHKGDIVFHAIQLMSLETAPPGKYSIIFGSAYIKKSPGRMAKGSFSTDQVT